MYNIYINKLKRQQEEHSADSHSASWSSRNQDWAAQRSESISAWIQAQFVTQSQQLSAVTTVSTHVFVFCACLYVCVCACVCVCVRACVCETNLSRSSCHRSVCIPCCSRRWRNQESWRRSVHSRVSPQHTGRWLKHTRDLSSRFILR